MMAFLAPLFLIGAVAAAIPIAIHLFHRRAEPVIEFAAMRYLRGAPVEHAHRRRLRELVLLALRVSALLLLALAFARPYFPQSVAAPAGTATIVLIDNSASLSAPGQFERARALAREAIDSAPSGGEVGVVTFAGGVEVLAPVSVDRAPAYAAVDRLTPGAGATRYGAALARSADLLAARPGRLVVITDLQATGWDGGDARGIPEPVEVLVREVGAPETNLAVASLGIEGAQAVAVVRNFSAHEADEQVTFTRRGGPEDPGSGDTPLGSVRLRIPAGGTAEARMPLDNAGGDDGPRVLSASIVDRHGYAPDNTRYVVLDAAAAPAILAVTTSGHPSEVFFLERAMAIADGADGFRFTTRSGAAFSTLTAGELGAFDVVAIVGTRGIERRERERLADYVRGGGGLLLTAGPDVDPAILGGLLGDLVRTTWSPGGERTQGFAPDDSRHPVFRPFGGVGTLGNVTFRRAVVVNASESADVIARYADGTPALVEEQVGDGRVLLFASDLNERWNDFPVHPTFVPFVHETLRYLAAPRAGRTEYLVGDVPGDAGRLPGAAVQAGRLVAVNVDPRESDPARMASDAFMSGVARLHAVGAVEAVSRIRGREDGQRWWQLTLAVMAIGLAAEGLLGRRAG